jgi:hypothetical protein
MTPFPDLGLRSYLSQRPARGGHVYHVGQLMGKRDQQLEDYTAGKSCDNMPVSCWLSHGFLSFRYKKRFLTFVHAIIQTVVSLTQQSSLKKIQQLLQCKRMHFVKKI